MAGGGDWEPEASVPSPALVPLWGSVILDLSILCHAGSWPGKGLLINPVQEEIIKNPFGIKPCHPGIQLYQHHIIKEFVWSLSLVLGKKL